MQRQKIIATKSFPQKPGEKQKMYITYSKTYNNLQNKITMSSNLWGICLESLLIAGNTEWKEF